jgi:hypothetical protein
MNKNDVIAALSERLGAPSSPTEAMWVTPDEATTVTVTELTNSNGPDRVEVAVFGAPRGVLTSLAVAETVVDFAWRIARREVAGLGTVAPLAVVVEAVFAMMGMSRYSYNEVLAAFVGDFGPRNVIRGDSSEWVRDDRVLRITHADEGVTVTMVEASANDGDEGREHLIVETTATPYAAERRTTDEARRKSGSCSLATALCVVQDFFAHGHYHGRRR